MTRPIAESDPNPAPMQPAVRELISDEFIRYLLTAKSEMFAVFRGLAAHVSQISMTFNEGRDMVLSSLISWNGTAIVLDFGASAEANRKALKAEKLFCVAQLDKVEIQFILRGVDRVEVDGRPAFRASLPDSILRLQRRENYRLVTSLVRPLKCRMKIPTPEGSVASFEANVADISGGGVGLLGLPLDQPLEPDMVLAGCSIELPEVGAVLGGLRLCWMVETISRSGVRAKRAGCEFIDLPPAMATLIQRYIIKIERERKARESGLA